MLINSESALPLYIQVKETLTRQIRNGTYKPHEMLPAERELIERFGVSRITVRRALADLVNAGLLYRKMGKGTYVSATPIVETLTELVGHLEELQRRDLHPRVTVLQCGYAEPPAAAAQALGDPGQVFYVRRLVQVDGQPLLLLDICIPLEFSAGLDAGLLSQVPINRLLEAQGFCPYAGEQRVAARGALEEEGRLLQEAPGSPVLEVVRTEWMASGVGLLWSRAVYRGDRYEYVIRLHRRKGHG